MRNLDNDFTLPPFPAFPCATRYVGVGSMQETMDRLSRAIDAREALSLVVGPPGTGKSLLCAMIAQRFSQTHDVVVMGDTVPADVKTLERLLLTRMGMPTANIAGDAAGLIEERINGEKAKPCGLLLIVDEAQSLSPEILESIRMLTNIMYQGQPRVSAILVGGVKLDETLTAPSLNPIAQRIATRCYLHPLNAGETRQYICGVIQDCGANPSDTINEEAIAAIHHATSGVPRLINQMMTEAIDCAAENNQIMIDSEVIDRAWARLQQLPSPMVEEPKIVGQSSTVEFGTLEPMNSEETTDTSDASTSSQEVVSSPESETTVDESCEPETEAQAVDTQVVDSQVAIQQLATQLIDEKDIADDSARGETIAELALALATFDCVSQIFDASSEDTCAMPSEANAQTQSQAETTEVTEVADEAANEVGASVEPLAVLSEWSNPEAAPLPTEMFADVDFGTVPSDVIAETDEQLFGEFEQEESLEIGRVTKTPAHAEQQVEEIASAESNDPAEMVYSEIISLSHFAADTIQIQTEVASQQEMPQPVESPLEAIQEEVIEEEASVVWYDEPEPESPRYEDDSDIVMISEEVPIEKPRHPVRIDSRETKLNVDYKSILAKMRNARA